MPRLLESLRARVQMVVDAAAQPGYIAAWVAARRAVLAYVYCCQKLFVMQMGLL